MARVLVIEDEPGIAMVLRIALGDEGHEVTTASDGMAGLKMLSRAPHPEVVFVDLNMPGLSGRTVVEIMHGTPVLKDIPVIILSGYIPDTPCFPPKGTYNALIAKPFDLSDVIEITNYLAAKGRHSNLFNSAAAG
ncbi:response regulator [Pelotomaculum propionicicum]|uniref:response regulator n=1 Tax=Pelotomaculum propionicicum TaxID=258475 RepID=UPI003B770E1D